MALEERKASILINTAGGTAGPGGRTYRVALPPVWVKQLGITETNREILLQFDGESITLRPMAPDRYDAFLAAARSRGHKLLILHFYDGSTLCTKICANQSTRLLAIENKVDTPLSTAFGVNQTPTWDDLQTFLEDRCIPQQRDGLSYYLEDLGLDHYDPLAIIRKTQGRMAEDACWIKIVEG